MHRGSQDPLGYHRRSRSWPPHLSLEERRNRKTGVAEAGVTALRNALWPILLLPLVLYVIQRDQIEREEQYLERILGEEYLTYKTRVRRWV